MLSNVAKLMSISDIQAQEYKTLSQERQSFAEGQLKEFKIPSDTTIKRMVLRIFGYVKITHGGAPTYDEAGILARLLSYIQVSQGNDTMKTIDPTICRRLQHLISKRAPVERYATGAAVPSDVTAEVNESGAPFTAPTSTHYIRIDSEISIDMEDPLASDFMGKQATLWSTHAKNNCRVRVQCGTFAGMHEYGNGGTSVVYSDSSISMELSIIGIPHVREKAEAPFLVYQESLLPVQVTSGSTDFKVQLPKSASKILGLAFLVRDTSANKKLSDTAIKKLRLTANNSRSFLDAGFKDLQRFNIETFGPEGNRMASGRHNLQGFAFANFRRDGDIVNNGIPADLDSLTVGFEASGSNDTPSESGNIEVLVAIQELRNQVRG